MQNCIMCQERQPAVSSEFCTECQNELDAAMDIDVRHFDAQYEWHGMGGRGEVTEHPAFRDFPQETRESLLEHRRKRIRKERRDTK